MDEEPLDQLTPRERDVYKVWKEHPDWNTRQISEAVFLQLHMVRRYRENIRRKLGDPGEHTDP
jgi:DNA-binding CsgD family transcriptional regulator